MLQKKWIVALSLITTIVALALAGVTIISAQGSGGPTDKWCSGVNIVFFPGGPVGGAFAVNVYNGALQAASDLGANVSYVWSDWDPQKMVEQFQTSMATNPDGIAIMGHPGDEAFKTVVDQAESQGIIVTSQNTELPTLEAAYASKGFGYVGASNYSAGHALGAQAVKQFNLQAGDEAMVWGLLQQPERGKRTQGVIDALKEAGLNVEEVEIDSATNADPSAGIPTFTAYVAAHPNLKLVVTDHGALTGATQTLLQAAGKGPDDIFMAGFDLSAATVDGIRGGWIDLVIDQQEWLQGYLPIAQICLTKKFAFSGLHIDTGAGFVTKDNVELVAPLAQDVIR